MSIIVISELLEFNVVIERYCHCNSCGRGFRTWNLSNSGVFTCPFCQHIDAVYHYHHKVYPDRRIKP